MASDTNIGAVTVEVASTFTLSVNVLVPFNVRLLPLVALKASKLVISVPLIVSLTPLVVKLASLMI